jgi:hypothetical protein
MIDRRIKEVMIACEQREFQYDETEDDELADLAREFRLIQLEREGPDGGDLLDSGGDVLWR